MSGPDFFREVEESIRAEKAAKFWKENGNLILMMAAALILGTAAQSIWTTYKNAKNEKSTALFFDALQSKSPADALQKLSKEDNGPGSALAGLNGASLAIEKKDWAAAIASYQSVLDNKSAAKPYKDLALVQMVSLQMDHDQKATGDALLKSLAPLASDKTSPWNSRAIFISAVIKADKNNDLKGALSDLNTLLAMPNLAPSFEEQVKSLTEVYKIKLGN